MVFQTFLTSKKIKFIIMLLFLSSIIYISVAYKLIAVSGNSMNPTFTNGQFVIMNANYNRNIRLQRNDIVAVSIPSTSKAYCNAIKRVVAIEGDEVIVDGNKVTVSGICTYLSDNFTISYPYKVYTLKQNEVFILGDNLNDSVDSRDSKIGIIDTSNVYAYRRGEID